MIVVAVLGATATGKTDLAFKLAQHFRTEILSFDSIQIYQGLDIGSAKPSADMLAEVKHHFIDELEPSTPFTAGDFRRQALGILKTLSATKEVAVLVGGTGFYLQALLKGMYEIPQVSLEVRASLQEDAKNQGIKALYDELQKSDPLYAQKIHPNDTYRIFRGLELLRSGKKPSDLRQAFEGEKFPYATVQLGLQRKKTVLRQAIEERTRIMLQNGLIEETRALLAEYSGPVRPLESVGYKEAAAYLAGQMTLEELQAAIIKNTMLLAKRQSTWFKRDSEIHWFDPDDTDVFKVSLPLIKQHLS